MQLPDDFREFLKLLNSHKVEYLLIGGFAVGYYGYPRATNDIDVWVARTEINATKLVAALDEFVWHSRLEAGNLPHTWQNRPHGSSSDAGGSADRHIGGCVWIVLCRSYPSNARRRRGPDDQLERPQNQQASELSPQGSR